MSPYDPDLRTPTEVVMDALVWGGAMSPHGAGHLSFRILRDLHASGFLVVNRRRYSVPLEVDPPPRGIRRPPGEMPALWRRHLRSLWWRKVCRWHGELCQLCGRRYYPMLWHATPELWAAVMPPTVALACPQCFTEKAHREGVTLSWFPLREAEAISRWGGE